MFFILKGTAIAHAGGKSVPLSPGDSILLPPGESHVIENTGIGKLYALCTMIPNEDFAELIHKGTPVPLGADDIAVITGTA
jgi:mannose-6-phosphate isomerase-like protein (cupin superfamily)